MLSQTTLVLLLLPLQQFGVHDGLHLRHPVLLPNTLLHSEQLIFFLSDPCHHCRILGQPLVLLPHVPQLFLPRPPGSLPLDRLDLQQSLPEHLDLLLSLLLQLDPHLTSYPFSLLLVLLFQDAGHLDHQVLLTLHLRVLLTHQFLSKLQYVLVALASQRVCLSAVSLSQRLLLHS